MRIRAPARSELAGLSPLLDRAFAGYAEALSYDDGPASLFHRWCWEHERSAVAVDEGGVYGAAVASARSAVWRGVPLEVVHVGPVAVAPERRGGVGTAMMMQVIAQARRDGADLMTLTTQQPYGAWRLYQRLGFRTLERFHPPWRPIMRRPDALPLEVSAKAWRSRVPARGCREGAIAERVLPPLPADAALRVRWFACDGAGVVTLRWPVLSRTRGETRRVFSVQVIDARGEGRGLHKALEAAEASALEDEATALFYLPSVSLPERGWRVDSSALTLRMCLPLTTAGKRAVDAASVYDDRAPAP